MRSTLLVLSALAMGVVARAPSSWQMLHGRQYDTSPIPPATCNLTAADREALNYELSNYVNGPSTNDTFYSMLPQNASDADFGSLLKLERVANASLYTLPPTTSISRFIYQSETLDGKKVPVSAYVLWPFAPRRQKDGKLPLVAFAHGTSGFTANCGPSNIRNLWQHFLAPFTLATQGYVVVGTDYAGMGVPRYPDGKPIIHPYAASPAHANDVAYSVIAAQKAFPELSKEWVAMGHSQGAGATWALAQRQFLRPVKGYLGSVAVSPLTTLLDVTTPAAGLLGLLIAPGVQTLQNILGNFNLLDVLTQSGLDALANVYACGGCLALANQVLGVVTEPLKANYKLNPAYIAWQALVVTGGKPISGPLFVAHGTADELLNYNLTARAVRATRLIPTTNIEFLTVEDSLHAPTLVASQYEWLDWIAARFRQEKTKHGVDRTIDHFRPTEALLPNTNWFIRLSSNAYEIA